MSDQRPQPPAGGPTPEKAEQPGERPGASPEIVVFLTRHDGHCAECGGAFFGGDMIKVENGKTLCLDCADLGHLEFLPRGDTALTRRASKHSPLRAVVVQWARARRRYERQGILVTPESIRRAEAECLADEERRARQRERAAVVRDRQEAGYATNVAAAVQRQFPGCPPEEATQIAEWTCRKHSGRVGRSAAAKELDPDALRLAVVAHIRHAHTKYDRLLMQTGDRALARQMVGLDIDRVLARWAEPAPR